MSRIRSGALSRLRRGEVVAGVGGAASLACVGWLPAQRGQLLPTGLSGVSLAYFQATRRAPALPAALSVVVTALGGASAVVLSARLARTPRDGGRERQAARLAVLASVVTACGGFASMRQEGGTDPAELGELETITLTP